MDDDRSEYASTEAWRHAEALAAHHGFVRSIARGLVSPSAVDDVAQEALLAALRSPPRERGALTGWLATAVRNVASKWHRSERRRAAREEAAAVGEELPSSRELVERLELSQMVVRAVVQLREPERTAVLWRFYEGRTTTEIAERLRVPADTVRSRLRRGLEAVRRQLDGVYGGRSTWMAALLPIAGLPPIAVGTLTASSTAASVSSTFTTTAAATGVVTMTTKTMAALLAIPVTAALAWLVVPDSLVERIVGAKPALGANVAGTAATSEAPLATAAESGSDPLAAERAVDPSFGGDHAAAIALPPPGSVALRVLDARSGKPLEDVRVRFLHENRFAEYHGNGEVNALLTSGPWEANVASPGFEPIGVERFEILVGTTTSLGTIALSPGSSAVEGCVLARHLPADQPVVVQLFGDGRSPCDHCRPQPASTDAPSEEEAAPAEKAPCACGYRPELDELTLIGDRRFRFGHLAAGVYWLRAFDPGQRIVDAKRIELGRGGSSWTELDVTAPTSVRFELRHGALNRGGLFTGDWSSVHREQPASIVFSFKRHGKDVGEVRIDPQPDDVRLTMGEPMLPMPGEGPDALNDWRTLIARSLARDLTSRISISWSWSGAQIVRSGGSDERLDRERVEGDALAFDFAEPDPAGASLDAARLRADLFEVKPLPRSELSVVVTCGHYASEEIALDLRLDPFAPFVIPLFPSKEWLDQLTEIEKGPPASCAACHSEGAAPTDVPAEIHFDFGEALNLDGGQIQLGEQLMILGGEQGEIKDH